MGDCDQASAGKLPLRHPLESFPAYFAALGTDLVALDSRHVLAEARPIPDTRDPFDRLLLAICQADGARLVTIDRSLVDHPLARRPATA